MRVMITGIDGYLGWPLALRLGALGHEVFGIDLGLRRMWVDQMDSISAVSTAPIHARIDAYQKLYGKHLGFFSIDLTDYGRVVDAYRETAPDAIVYLGEQPSAPFSMIDVEHAMSTQRNNVLGTLVTIHAMQAVCPQAHLLKLGTMGEYGTPPCNIPEGCFPSGSYWTSEQGIQPGSIAGLMFPRQAGSWYHLSKVHDTYNVEFACRVWGLRATDVMQGPVYGSWIQEMEGDCRLRTRMDFDECFGTIVNRFCVQAVLGIPLTVYGAGGQTRGYLPLEDSIACMVLALDNPPEAGEYRTLNQFDQTYTVNQLAEKVVIAAGDVGIGVKVEHLDNPRVENEKHYYAPESGRLREMGYKPIGDIEGRLRWMIEDLIPRRKCLSQYKHAVAPKIRWRP